MTALLLLFLAKCHALRVLLQVMNEAHVDSVLLLAVPFHEDAGFNFGQQTITQEIQVRVSIAIHKD